MAGWQFRGTGRSVAFAVILFFLFPLAACGGGAEPPVAITGKTVYRGMAIEGVRLRVLRLRGGEWGESASVRSGYHGSFVAKTSPGTIRLEAQGEIWDRGRKVLLAGGVDSLEIPTGIQRMDRVVIELVEVSNPGFGSPAGADREIK